MCRERRAFGGTHPPGISGVRATEYKFPFGVRVVAQDTGFPVLEGRASETRLPGNCGRLCRETQFSQGRPLFWGLTSVERGSLILSKSVIR